MISVIQCTTLVIFMTMAKWESHNSQIIMKYGGITLIGAVTGLIMGDPLTGLAAGGTMELMQVGLIGVVGSSVPDYQIAACIGTALAVAQGKGLEAALMMGVPAAALNVNFDILAKMTGEALMHRAKRRIEDGRYREGLRIIATGSFTRPCLTGTLPVSLYLTFGPSVASAIVEKAPEWIWNGMELAGGVLPALGICLLAATIPGRMLWIVLAGFTLASATNLSLALLSLIGVIAACIAYRFPPVNVKHLDITIIPTRTALTDELYDNKLFGASAHKGTIPASIPVKTLACRFSKRDLRRTFVRNLCTLQSCFNYETHISCGAVYTLAPMLRRVYDDDKTYRTSLLSLFNFYNCQAYFSTPLLGASLAVEETLRSKEGIEFSAHLRTSLMAPLTGMGDALFNTAIKAVAASVSAHYAMQGSPLGILPCILFGLLLVPIRWRMFLLGYLHGPKCLFNNTVSFPKLIGALLTLESVVVGVMIARNVTIKGFSWTQLGVPGGLAGMLDGWHVTALLVFCLLFAVVKNRRLRIPSQILVWAIIALCLGAACLAA